MSDLDELISYMDKRFISHNDVPLGVRHTNPTWRGKEKDSE